MDTLSKIKGLYAIGLPTILATLNYGVRKWRYDAPARRRRAEQSRLPWLQPGPLKETGWRENAFVAQFKNAELELCFLDGDLLRVTWTPGVLPVPYTISDAPWPMPRPKLTETPEGFVLEGAGLRLELDRQGGLVVSDGEGRLLRQDAPPQRRGDIWEHRADFQEGERVFGLGQRTGSLNLRGGVYNLWNTEPKGDYGPGRDPIYVSSPLLLSITGTTSWLVYYENTHRATADLRKDCRMSFEGGALRYYLTPGVPDDAMRRMGELIGRPFLPPRWALGYHQARWSYMNEAEVREVVAGFESHGLPLRVLHLDIHYMDGYRVFTVDPARFPDLAGLCAELESRGVKVVTIMDVGVKTDPAYDVYREGLAIDAFCKLPDGRVVEGPVWPGRCAFPDFTKPAVRDWWGAYYERLTGCGVSGIWHDMNEPAVFTPSGHPTLPDPTRHDMDGRGGDHVEAHNLYALLENRAAFEALRRLRPACRPWLLSRSGWTGLQRYAWNWTGDTGSNWWSLRQNVRLALMLGISGIPYTGPDIGGFNGEPSPELYTRWFEAAAFLPFFRTHSATFLKRREPWSYGEPTTAISRKFMLLRERLLPFWYTLAAEAARDSRPLVRPLWWEERTPRLLDVEDAFLLGRDLLVAPVLEEGASRRDVVFPSGLWHDFITGERYRDTATCEAPLEHLPLFVRDGALIPMQEAEGMALHLYLSDDSVGLGGAVYLDAGDGYGPGRWDVFRGERDGTGFVVRRHTEGDYPEPESGYRLHVHGLSGLSLECGGTTRPVDARGVGLPPGTALFRLTR